MTLNAAIVAAASPNGNAMTNRRTITPAATAEAAPIESIRRDSRSAQIHRIAATTAQRKAQTMAARVAREAR